MSHKIKQFYEFGDFRFDAEKRVLWREGEIIPLAPKASEVLLLLIKNHGNLLERDELLQKVWQNTFVEEGNLNHAISALRKALGGNGIIQTMPRRGYRFTADVKEVFDAEPDLVIEKRTLSHTLIEEREELQNEKLSIRQTIPTKANRIYLVITIFAILLLAGFGSGWYFRNSSNNNLTAAKTSPKTLAILPLQSLNAADDEKAFGLGITEALVSRLGSLKHLAVRPTKSVERIAKNEDDPVEIGRKLDADVVITGTFQRANGRIRISMRLLNVADGSQIWAGNFDEPEADIFRLQDSFSEQIIQSLALNLTAKEKLALSKRPTENSEAYKFYLQGREIWSKRGDRNVAKSIFYFERAIELDSNFALAYSGLADAQAMLNNPVLAEENIHKALALDENLAEAHASLGFLRIFHHFDWKRAERELKRAVELNPNYATAHHWLGFYYSLHGRLEEAKVELMMARNLDPTSPIILADLGQLYYFMRDYDKAIEFCKRAIELDPEARTAHEYLLYIYFKQGREKEAFEENLKTERANNPNPIEFENAVRRDFAASGIRGIFQERLNAAYQDVKKPKEKRTVFSEPISEILKNNALLGNNEEALRWIGRAYEERRVYHLLYLKVDPIYDAVHADSRFQEVLGRMSFSN